MEAEHWPWMASQPTLPSSCSERAGLPPNTAAHASPRARADARADARARSAAQSGAQAVAIGARAPPVGI
eukprot:2591633-Pleurochrysis_carterae.AAC.2